jgi:hypothetical protein
MEAYAGRQFVGMDLHRRRSVLVRMTPEGEVLERVRIVNDADSLAAVMARSEEGPEVVLEARPPMAGTGRWTRCRRPAPVCTWPIRWA